MYQARSIFLSAALLTLLVLSSPASAGNGRQFRLNIDHARAVHATQANRLFHLPGVHGVGIGENSGKPHLLVLVDDARHLPSIPGSIDNVPVVTQVSERFQAHAASLGTSGGNGLVCGGYCSGGTIGFKVCDNTASGVMGFITNNHVAASGCPSLCPNKAPIGTSFYAPGVIDNNPVCSTNGASAIGALNRFVPLVMDGSTINYADAAFVESSNAQVSDTIHGIGVQNDTAVDVYLGQAVCKSGRTSGMTCGKVTAINLTVDVDYDQACGTGRFSNVIMYAATSPYTVMSEAGDSGSPVVDANTEAAVALNFAGSQAGDGIGIPIKTVLSQLNVSLCTSQNGTSPAPSTTQITIATSPAGRPIIVDGTTYTAPQTFSWEVGSNHALGTASPQTISAGSRYAFSSWSDGGAQNHSITVPSSPTSYTAAFSTQYQLTSSVAPTGGGRVAPDCSAGCWYGSNTSASLTATPNANYTFSAWTGSISSASNPVTIKMDGAKSITAQFATAPASGNAPSLAGSIKKGDGTAMAGVAVALSGQKTNTVSTDAAGNYTFTNLAAGTYTVTPSLKGFTFTPAKRSVVVQKTNVTGVNFVGTAAASSLPNLAPYKPSGWADKMFISNTSNATSDSNPIKSGSPTYLNWAIINNGNTGINRLFYIYVYVDGALAYSWYYNSSLPASYYLYARNSPMSSLAKGTHTISITVDPTNTITESNESDNTYSKTITVQ